MKYPLLILFLCLYHFAPAQGKTPNVKVISATTQDWISGAPGGRAGTTYTIKVGILADKPITFKSMWLGRQTVHFDVQTFFADPNKKPGKGDSVLLVYVKPHTPQSETTSGNAAPPIAYKGDALVEYLVDGRLRYFTIKRFNRLEIIKGR